MDYLTFASQLSRERARQKVEALDPLSPAEKASIEEMCGRSLTMEEAQIFWRTLALEAAFIQMYEGKKEN
jgi:hypothetical protein